MEELRKKHKEGNLEGLRLCSEHVFNNGVPDMTQKKKLVYVPMAVDFIHPGHLNIIKVAQDWRSDGWPFYR